MPIKNSIFEGLNDIPRNEKQLSSNSFISIYILSNSGHRVVIFKYPSKDVDMIADDSLMYNYVIFFV